MLRRAAPCRAVLLLALVFIQRMESKFIMTVMQTLTSMVRSEQKK